MDMSHDVYQRIGIPLLAEQMIANRRAPLPSIHRDVGWVAIARKLWLIVAHAAPLF